MTFPCENIATKTVFVMIAFVLTVVLLPILLRLMEIKKPDAKVVEAGRYERAVATLVQFTTANAKMIVLVFGLLLAFSLWSISLLQFSHNPLKWFPEDADIRVSTELMGEKVGGVIPIELLLDTGKANFLFLV